MTNIFEEEWDVGGVKAPSTLSEDLHLDRLNLNDEFERHAERYAFYSTAYELCLDKERRVKAALERAYAQLDAQARAQLTANGIRITEKKVENMVITTDDYISLQEEYFESQRWSGLLKAARDAMIHKKECMVSLGANFRQEVNSNPSILMETYKQTHGNK